MNLTAEQSCDLAADRKTQSRAAVLAAGGAIGLAERFEDDLLLVVRNADAGIVHLECDHVPSAVQDLVVRIPPRLDALDT